MSLMTDEYQLFDGSSFFIFVVLHVIDLEVNWLIFLQKWPCTLSGGTFLIYACLFVFSSLVIFDGWGWPTSTHSHTCSSLQPIYSPPLQKKERALFSTLRQIVVDSNMVIPSQREDSLVRPCVHNLFTLTIVPSVSVCHPRSTISSITHPVLQGVFVNKIPNDTVMSAKWAHTKSKTGV